MFKWQKRNFKSLNSS